MSLVLLLFASLLIVYPQTYSIQFVKYCISDAQCSSDERCLPNTAGLLFCQQMPSTATTKACRNDAQCDGFEKCTQFGWYGICQHESPGWKILGGMINDPCYTDADCGQYLQCANRNGKLTCQLIADNLLYNICQSDMDCGMMQKCSYSKEYRNNLCLSSSEGQNDKMNLFRNADIGHGVMIRNSIGNGVITNLKKECTADYQCSVYEVCAESSISGKRRCTYNPTATYRQCRFNADCQSSQRCEKVLQNLHICRMTKLPTYMQPCTNDYECSAEQRCTDIGSDNSFQRYSRRCLTVDDEPPCISDGDCADTTKICRTSGKIKQCLPVIMNADFAL